MPEIRLTADPRTDFGKGAARRTRRAGMIPAVIYGHGGQTRHVALPAHDFSAAIRKNGLNALLTLSVDGKDELAIAKAIQRHPVKSRIEHVDLLAVRRGEQVTVEVPLTVTGEVAPNGLLTQEFTSVTLHAEATHIPEDITVSVEGLQVGAQVTAGDLALPRGATLAGDPEQTLLIVSASPTAAQLEAQDADAAEELGIVRDAPDSESSNATDHS